MDRKRRLHEAVEMLLEARRSQQPIDDLPLALGQRRSKRLTSCRT